MNTKSLLLLLILSGSLLTLSSCKLNDVDDPTIIVDIDDEFSVRMWETISPTTSTFQLRTETISEETCLNYEIAYEVIRRSNRIRTSIDDIIEPDDCLPGKASAQVEMEIGVVKNGLYEFEINLKNSTIVNTGQLVVSDESYSVEMNSTNGITLYREKLFRVPTSTIWGYLSAENVEPIAKEFMLDLADLSVEKVFTVGDYGYFLVAGNNTLDLPIESNFADNQTFIINYSGEIHTLKTIAADYRVRYGADLKLQIFTWEGETL